jgi:hypothetical protein
VAGRGRALRPPLTASLPRVESYRELAERIAALPPAGGLRTRIVAVDGQGAAGKTTFSGRLAAALGGAPVVHTDDVFTRVGHPWWPTLEADVLAPLAAGGPAVLLIEGISSSRRAIAGRLAYGIWLQVPTGSRMARGITRDGPQAAADWDRYEAEETEFFSADPVWQRADLVVDGAPGVPHDPENEYVRLR